MIESTNDFVGIQILYKMANIRRIRSPNLS